MDFTLCLSDAGINASWVGIFRLSTMNWSHRLPHVNAQPSSLNCEVPYVCLQVQLEYLIFQIEFAELKIQFSTNSLCKLYSKRKKKKNLIVARAWGKTIAINSTTGRNGYSICITKQKIENYKKNQTPDSSFSLNGNWSAFVELCNKKL